MTAQIVIDDGTNPASSGSTDNPNSFVGDVHTLSNFDNTGVLSQKWTLIDKPAGSGTTLSSGTAPIITMTPDRPGSYMVRLETFSDVPSLIADDADEQEVGVRFPTPFDWLLPGAGETTQQDASSGWKTEVNRFLSETRRNLLSKPGTIVTAVRTATIGELVLYDPSGGSFTISAPGTPVLGDRFAIKNTTTDVTALTIDGNSKNIEDPGTSTLVPSFSLGVAFIGLDFLFDGTNWIIV